MGQNSVGMRSFIVDVLLGLAELGKGELNHLFQLNHRTAKPKNPPDVAGCALGNLHLKKLLQNGVVTKNGSVEGKYSHMEPDCLESKGPESGFVAVGKVG